jgi:hypothetical protein
MIDPNFSGAVDVRIICRVEDLFSFVAKDIRSFVFVLSDTRK